MLWTSVRKDDAPRWMGKFLTVLPKCCSALVAGWTKLCEPMSSPKTSATLFHAGWLGPYITQPTMPYASKMSAGTRRWKYGSLVLLNSDCPVMQNIGMCALLTIGATAEASSDVQPTTAIKLELLAIIWLAAGAASAGSPRVSNF